MNIYTYYRLIISITLTKNVLELYNYWLNLYSVMMLSPSGFARSVILMPINAYQNAYVNAYLIIQIVTSHK